LLAEDFLDLRPRDGTDLLQPKSALADDDGLLRGALYEDEADLADYIHFQERDGPDVEVFYFPTTPEDDKQIIDRIMEIGGCGFAECTVCSSAAVRGIGPFKTLGAVRTPLGFAKALRELQKDLQKK